MPNCHRFPSQFGIYILLSLPFFPPLAFAEESASGIFERIHSLEERLSKIEVRQQEILARDEKIRAKIEEVRVWAHRRPGPKGS